MFWISVDAASGKSERKVEGDRLTVGRSEDSDLVISHQTLSRRHAVFTFEDGSIFIEDLGSANGTFVNGEKIPVRRRLRLDAEDEITLGESDARLRACLQRPNQTAPKPRAVAATGPAAPFEKREGPKVLREEIETLLSIKASEQSELEALRRTVADLQDKLDDGRRSLEDLESERARVQSQEASHLAATTADVTQLIERYLASLDLSRESIVPLLSEVNALMTGDESPPLVHRWQRLQPRLTGAMAGIALTLAGLGVYRVTMRLLPEESKVPLRVVAATPAPAPAPVAVPVKPREYRSTYVESVTGSHAFATKYLGASFQRRLTRELVPKAAKDWSVDQALVQQALNVTAELVRSLADKGAGSSAPSAEDLESMRQLESEALAQLTELLKHPNRPRELMELERAMYPE